MELHRFDVELGPDALHLRLHGLAAFGAMRRRVDVPYRHIRSVDVGPIPKGPPRLLRLGGLGAGALRIGTFRRGGEWLFLAVNTHGDVVHVRLDGSGPERVRFSEVAISAHDPQALAAEIRARLG